MGIEQTAAPPGRTGAPELSPKRIRAFSFSFKHEKEHLGAGATPPFFSAPSSPVKFLRSMDDVDGNSAVTESLLPPCHLEGAVPFKWEEKPGTPKSPLVPLMLPWEGVQEQQGEEVCAPGVSKEKDSPRVGPLSPLHESAETCEAEEAEFDFSNSIFQAHTAGGGALARNGGGEGVLVAAADQLIHQGQILPLKLPPRLQSQLVISKQHSRSPTSESLILTEAGDDMGSFRSLGNSFRSPTPATPTSLGQAVGLTMISGRVSRSASASPAQKLLALCGLSNRTGRRATSLSALGGDEPRLSYSDVHLMSGQLTPGSTGTGFSSAKESVSDVFFSSSSEQFSRVFADSGPVSSVDGLDTRCGESNLASADCSLVGGRACVPGTPMHRKGKSFSKEKGSGSGSGFFFGLRSGKEEQGARKGKKLFKEEAGTGSPAALPPAHRRVRSLSPLRMFRRADKDKPKPKRASVEEKDAFSFDSHASWPLEDREREYNGRAIAGVPKKLVGSNNVAWTGLKGLSLDELLEEPRDGVAGSRQTDSPASNSSSGSIGGGRGSFGSFSSSNSGSNSSVGAELVDGALPYCPQDVKPGRFSNASASPGLKKALLAKNQASQADSSPADTSAPEHFPLYRRYKTEQPCDREESVGRLKALLPNRTGILSCLGCSSVKNYQAFRGMSRMRVGS